MNKILLLTSTALLSATTMLSYAQATHKRTVPINNVSPSAVSATLVSYGRSEERRVGKECSS